MSKGYSAKIGLDISDVDKKVNSLSRELKTIDNSLKTNGDSAALLSQKYTVMGEKAQALSEKLKALEGARSDVMDAFNRGDISSDELRSYEREVENTKGELKGLLPSLGDVSEAFNVLGEAVQKVTQLAAAFVKESIEVGKQFESSMSQVAATMAIDKLSDDFQMLSDKAKEMGATTRFTASQAADALNYLALAGYNAVQATEALPKVLSLAQAGGMELARASDMITDTISALHLSKNDMDTLIDQMAKTAQRSNTSVSQLGDALLTLGGTAASIASRGDSGLAEINALLGILADNGIKASEGGTHLRNILLKMSKPTKNMKALMEKLNIEFYDLEGNLRPIPEIFLEMKQKMDDLGMTQAEKDSLINKAFNPTDIASVNALLGTTSDRFEQLTNEIKNADSAASTMADTMNQNLDGALRTLESAKQAVQVELYEKINEPLAKIVNNVAAALTDISSEISDAGFGEEFTEALNKISDAVKEALPQIVELFKRFSDEVVPRLGDVAVKIVDITADKVLPRMLDMFEWLIDHSSEVETGIKVIIAAMATSKVMDFTNGLFGTVTQLTAVTTGATNAAGALSGAAGAAGAGAAALAGPAGLIAQMNLVVVAMEAAAAAGLLLKDAIDKAGDAAMRNAKYMNGFTDASNAMWDRYREVTSGENTQSSTQISQQLEKDNDDLEKAYKERERLEKKYKSIDNRLRDFVVTDDQSLRKKEELEAERDAAKLEYDQKHQEVIALENLIHEEKQLLDERVEQEEKADKQRAENARVTNQQNVYSQKKADEMQQKQLDEENKRYERLIAYRDGLQDKLRTHEYANAEERMQDARKLSSVLDDINAIDKQRAEKKEKQRQEEEQAQREQEQADAEEFAARLEYQEELWDKEYHWDKENYKEYWEKKEKFLAENRVDTKEWNEAWNETEKKLGKMSDQTGKEIENNLKDAEKKVKDALDKYKNKLKHAVAAGDMTEYEANEALGHYLETNIDKSSDLYVKEHTEYLNKRKSLDDQLTKDQEKEYNDNKKKQEDQIKKKFRELETQARNDEWSDRKLWNEKMRYLKEMKRNNEVYLEVYDDTMADMREEQSKIREKERNEQEKQNATENKKDAKSLEEQNKERKKIFDAAEKEAEDIVKKYYQSNRDELAKFGQDHKTVTDAGGKERLIFTDYNKKLQELKAYQKNLEKLKTMGLSNEHLKEIFGMDLDTRMKYISELVRMGGDQRAKYLRDYNAYKKTEAKVAQTTMYFQQDEIKEEIKDKFTDVTKDAGLSAEQTAKAWQTGWEKGMKGYDLGLDFLPSEITSGAAAYDKSRFDAVQKLGNSVNDLTQKIMGTAVNINIDNKTACKTTFKELLTAWSNSGSKSMG